MVMVSSGSRRRSTTFNGSTNAPRRSISLSREAKPYRCAPLTVAKSGVGPLERIGARDVGIKSLMVEDYIRISSPLVSDSRIRLENDRLRGPSFSANDL